MNKINTVGATRVPGKQWSGGVAYVYWPKDVSRDDYVKDCYLNYRVSIILNDGSTHNRVPVDQDTMNHIDIPTTNQLRGTALVYIQNEAHKLPIIVGSVNKIDQLGQLKEFGFRHGRVKGEKVVEINGNVDEAVLNLLVKGKGKVGRINMVIDNDNSDCELNIDVSGAINVESTGQNSTLSQNSIVHQVLNKRNKDKFSGTKIDENRTLIGNSKVVINGDKITLQDYRGYKVEINELGINIDALDKPITLKSNDAQITINDSGIDIQANKIKMGGVFPALYNKIPGTPILDVSQIGSSTKIKIS